MVPKIVMTYYEKKHKKNWCPHKRNQGFVVQSSILRLPDVVDELAGTRPWYGHRSGHCHLASDFLGEAEWVDDPSIPRHAMFL
jgi:hypothetical protein